ncbi:MAG: TauD/TfdA family dioxygenase [Myxococcota bacterium]
MNDPRLEGLAVSLEQFGNGPGVVVTSQGAKVRELPIRPFKELLQERGALVFRGFDASKSDFVGFARLFMKQVKTTPEVRRRRDKLHPGLQTALLGNEGLNFHADFAQVPQRTHIISFYCAVPAQWGGETLVTDGEELLRALSPSTREALRTRRIRHSTTLDRANWSAFSGTQDATEIVRQAREVPGLECVHNPDDTLTTHWVTSAVTPSVLRSEPCLCTNIFPGVYNGLVTTWEDGSPIPREITDEIQQKAAELSARIVWNRAGDFAIVDNTRYVHARTQQDGIRVIFTMQGYVT